MGGTGSGRKSVKGMAVKLILDVQIMLNELLYDELQGSKSREQLEDPVKEMIQEAKKVQEEIERL